MPSGPQVSEAIHTASEIATKSPDTISTTPQIRAIKWIDSGRCLDVEAGRNENGTKIHLWECQSNNNNQKFKYENGQIKWIDSMYYKQSPIEHINVR